MKRYFLVAAVALTVSSTACGAQDGRPAPVPCTSAMGLNFVCDLGQPEDFVQIPGTKYLITGGSAGHGGWGLIDTQTKTSRPLDLTRPRPDLKTYPDCPAMPDPKRLTAHGVAIRTTSTPGLFTYYTVTHGFPFESIQVLALDARGALPELHWTGCVKVPDNLRGNGVTAAMDGTIYDSIQMKDGAKQADYFVGKVTGGLFQWKPSDKTWRLLPGTEFAGNNGVEISKDEKEIYQAVSGSHSIEIISLADTAKPVRRVELKWFNVDNIHWSGDQLLTAGVIEDEPACGGTRKEMVENKLDPACHRGFVVARIDPAAATYRVLAYGPAIAEFGGASTAQIVGGNLWISSNQMDRAAWLPLPGLKH
jgi:hypothetical protein